MSEYSPPRNHPRKTHNQPIELEHWTPISLEKGNEVLQVESIDISSGGLSLVTPRTLEVGEVVKLEVPVSDKDVTLPVFAEVVWSHKQKKETRAGLRFLM